MTRILSRGAQHKQILDTLVDLVRDDDLARGRARLAACDVRDLSPLVASARAHGVEPWLAACIPSSDGQFLELAEQRSRFLAARARSLATARDLGSRLDASGTKWAVLKGLALAELAYPRADLRYAVDIDVLVPPARLERTITELVSSGYQLLDVNWPLLAHAIPGQLRLRAPNRAVVDLHWHVLNQRSLRTEFRLPTDELLGRARPFDRGALRGLDPVDAIIHVALHAALSGGNRLIWLLDVDRLVRATTPDWDVVLASATAARAGLPVAVVLARAKATLETPVEDITLRRLAGGQTWLAGARAVDSLGLLRFDPSTPSAAVAYARSTRSRVWRSQVEFARHGIAWLRSGAPRSRAPGDWTDANSHASALRDVPDVNARARYFASVTSSRD